MSDDKSWWNVDTGDGVDSYVQEGAGFPEESSIDWLFQLGDDS